MTLAIDPTFERYLTRTLYTKRLKRLKKKQWVGQPFAIQASKVTLDPHVRAANWLCDSLTHSNPNIIEQAVGLSWVEQTGDSYLDWRELWATELDKHGQFAWYLIHVGPEGLYQAANLSDGEREVMRLKQEGHTQDQVAFITEKSLGTIQKMLSRGYAKIAREFQLPARPKRLNHVVNTLAGISRRNKTNPQTTMALAGRSQENLIREAA